MLRRACFAGESSRRWLAMVLVGAALNWGGARGVEANAIQPQFSYATSGTIDSAGVSGAAAVQFIPQAGVSESTAPFSLGAFVVGPAADGSVTRYDRTPVMISYATRAIDGTTTAGPDGAPAAPMMIRGWLSGAVGGSSPAALAVLFDQGLQPDDIHYYQPHPLPPLPAGSSVGAGSPGTLSLLGGESLLRLNTEGRPTAIEAQVNLAPNVPEPASYLVFLGVVGGCIFARRRLARS